MKELRKEFFSHKNVVTYFVCPINLKNIFLARKNNQKGILGHAQGRHLVLCY
jgi:hypothetical protein